MITVGAPARTRNPNELSHADWLTIYHLHPRYESARVLGLEQFQLDLKIMKLERRLADPDLANHPKAADARERLARWTDERDKLRFAVHLIARDILSAWSSMSPAGRFYVLATWDVGEATAETFKSWLETMLWQGKTVNPLECPF